MQLSRRHELLIYTGRGADIQLVWEQLSEVHYELRYIWSSCHPTLSTYAKAQAGLALGYIDPCIKIGRKLHEKQYRTLAEWLAGYAKSNSLRTCIHMWGDWQMSKRLRRIQEQVEAGKHG